MFTPKNVFPITVIASPKYPPKSIPHTNVEMPQYINILSVFAIVSSIFGNFFKTIKHPINIKNP